MNNILQFPNFLNIINESNLSFDDNHINENKALDNYVNSNTKDFAFQLERLDEEFFNSKYRKDNFYVKQIRERTYVSLVGTVRFSRRQYQSKHDGSYYYFVDDIIDFPPFKRLSWGDY